MYWITALGLFAALCTTTAFLPQAVKTIRTKQVRDLSVKTYLIQLTGNFSWLSYGIATKTLPIIVADSITSVIVLTTLFHILKFRKNPSL
jgi:MtN3 and saliva related transmembrane protein